jgi:hypothetical protein
LTHEAQNASPPAASAYNVATMKQSPAMRRDWLAIIVIVIEIAIGVSAAAMLYAVWLNM